MQSLADPDIYFRQKVSLVKGLYKMLKVDALRGILISNGALVCCSWFLLEKFESKWRIGAYDPFECFIHGPAGRCDMEHINAN